MSREDFNQLLNALIPFAQKMLTQYGQFAPFAGGVGDSGEVELLGGYPQESATAQQIHDALFVGLQQAAREGKYRATGLCADVRVRRGPDDPGSEAISVSLEHSDGTAVDVYLPYQRPSAGGFEYGELFGTAAEARIFAPPAS